MAQHNSASNKNIAEPIEAVLALERGALGAAILDTSGRQAEILCEFVCEDDWQSSLHRAVFRAIRELVRRGSVPLDYCAICAELIREGVYQSYTNCVLLIVTLGEGVVLARPMAKRIQELRAAWNQRKELAAAQ